MLKVSQIVIAFVKMLMYSSNRKNMFNKNKKKSVLIVA